MFCYHCGMKISEGDNFCTRCGQRVSGIASQSSPIEAPAKDEDFEMYIRSVNARLGNGTWIPHLNAWCYYDEEFRVKWGASKMKRFSFITCMEKVDDMVVRNFSGSCTQYALHNYPGLARGMQVGVASFAVIASRNIAESAVRQVMETPPTHFAAFEMPILLDLNTRRLYHMQKTPLWGALIWSDLRKYADQKLAPLWEMPQYAAPPIDLLPVVDSRPDGTGNCLFTCPGCGGAWQLSQGQGTILVQCPRCGKKLRINT